MTEDRIQELVALAHVHADDPGTPLEIAADIADAEDISDPEEQDVLYATLRGHGPGGAGFGA